MEVGEVHLAQIAITYPQILEAISKGFKDAISDRDIDGQLYQIIGNVETNGEAILKTSEALVDLELSLVTPHRPMGRSGMPQRQFRYSIFLLMMQKPPLWRV